MLAVCVVFHMNTLFACDMHITCSCCCLGLRLSLEVFGRTVQDRGTVGAGRGEREREGERQGVEREREREGKRERESTVPTIGAGLGCERTEDSLS